MEMEQILDIPEFRKHLKEMPVSAQGIEEDGEHPQELEELVGAIGRVEKELATKTQQLIADFFMVYSFIQAFNEESDEDDLEFEDEESEQ